MIYKFRIIVAKIDNRDWNKFSKRVEKKCDADEDIGKTWLDREDFVYFVDFARAGSSFKEALHSAEDDLCEVGLKPTGVVVFNGRHKGKDYSLLEARVWREY